MHLPICQENEIPTIDCLQALSIVFHVSSGKMMFVLRDLPSIRFPYEIKILDEMLYQKGKHDI